MLRAPRQGATEPVVETLVRCGVRVIELTLTSPGVLAELPRLRERFESDCAWGVGTVTSEERAREAIEAGADFLVTPVLVPGVIDVAQQSRVPIVSGALTPSEIHDSYARGADAVKLFPASLVGPQFLRELRGPFPSLAVMPSGGVGIDDIPSWLAAGAMAVSLGGALIGDAFEGDRAGLADRATRAQAAVEEHRAT